MLVDGNKQYVKHEVEKHSSSITVMAVLSE